MIETAVTSGRMIVLGSVGGAPPRQLAGASQITIWKRNPEHAQIHWRIDGLQRATRCPTIKWGSTRMSSTHQISSREIGFLFCERGGLKPLGPVFLWLICAIPILLGTTSIPESKPSPAKGTPTEAMKTTVRQALEVLQDKALKKPERTDERVTRLKKIADTIFDYGEMAKRSLGGQWIKLEEREQQEFVGLFTEFLTATYVEKIHSYSDEEVKFLNERLEGDYAEVKSIMVGKKTETPLDYRLMKKDGEWKAYDVVVDGISLVRNYREQFATILRSSSYEDLVLTLRDKVAQYNVKTKSSETSMSPH